MICTSWLNIKLLGYGGLIFEFSGRNRVGATVNHLVVQKVTFHLQLQLQSSIFCWRNRGIIHINMELNWLPLQIPAYDERFHCP